MPLGYKWDELILVSIKKAPILAPINVNKKDNNDGLVLQALHSFGDNTAEYLVKEERAKAVKDYLSRIADGGYA